MTKPEAVLSEQNTDTPSRRYYSAEEIFHILGNPMEGIQVTASNGLPTNLLASAKLRDS